MHSNLPLIRAHDGSGVFATVCRKEGDHSSSPHFSLRLCDMWNHPFETDTAARLLKRKATSNHNEQPPNKKLCTNTTTPAVTESNLNTATNPPPTISYIQFGDSPPFLPSGPLIADDFSASYSSQRTAIISHQPDTLVLKHPSFLPNLWPESDAINCLFTTFTDTDVILEPDQRRLLHDPSTVQDCHFHGKEFMGNIDVAHLTISPAFFARLGSPHSLTDVKVIADIKVQHLYDTVYEANTALDLTFNYGSSSTPLLATAMNTLFFVFKGEYVIYVRPCIMLDSRDTPLPHVRDPHRLYELGQEVSLKCHHQVIRHSVKGGSSLFLPKGHTYTIF